MNRGLFDLELLTVSGEEISHCVGDVLGPFVKRRYFNHHNAESEEEVFAELLFPYRCLEIAMRGGEDAYVNPQAVAAAEALNGFFLQHAQQLRLRVKAHVADFVEKDGAAIGLLEAADPPLRQRR